MLGLLRREGRIGETPPRLGIVGGDALGAQVVLDGAIRTPERGEAVAAVEQLGDRRVGRDRRRRRPGLSQRDRDQHRRGAEHRYRAGDAGRAHRIGPRCRRASRHRLEALGERTHQRMMRPEQGDAGDEDRHARNDGQDKAEHADHEEEHADDAAADAPHGVEATLGLARRGHRRAAVAGSTAISLGPIPGMPAKVHRRRPLGMR